MRFEIKMPEQRDDDDDEEGMMTTTEKGVTKTCTVASSWLVFNHLASSAFFSFDSLEQKRQETHLETERK